MQIIINFLTLFFILINKKILMISIRLYLFLNMVLYFFIIKYTKMINFKNNLIKNTSCHYRVSKSTNI